MSGYTTYPEVEEQGFAVIQDVFRSEFLNEALKEISRWSPRRSRAGVRHALRLEPVGRIARSPQLTKIASGVLGPAAVPFRATLFDKTPDANWLVVWHQDTALPLTESREVQGWGPWSVKEGVHYAHAPATTLAKVLALRVHFDESGRENGPLRVLPGTHHSGVLTDDQIQQFATRISPVDCLVSKGGVIAMRPLIVHASSKLQNESPRRVLHIEYAASNSIASPLELEIV